MRTTRFAIVGAGPVGLAVARLLQIRGLDVAVFERDASREPRRGGSLDLKPESGLIAIDRTGLRAAFLEKARSEGISFRSVDAETLAVRFEDDTSTDPEIDRADLRDLLLDSLQPETVSWAHELEAVHETDGGFELEFRGKGSVKAEFIIGCDGLRSRVRPLVTPLPPHYTGITVIEVTAASPLVPALEVMDRLVGNGSLLASESGRAIWAQRTQAGTIRAYFSYAAQEGAAVPSAEQLKQLFSSFNPALTALIESATSPFRPWPLYICPPDQSWPVHPRITILGDAAHVMPPFTGAGVNNGLLDAVQFVDALESDSRAEFEAGMRSRTRTEMLRTLEAAVERYGSAVILP
ncbi:FAD-dependent oxidoreductase [Stenotrophomonas maltophilia]|uniref:FAD-dependent oxidoreductase n=1 Tax=Stenotrophomonas maltophilia TaxID=40324 RepID=UPI00143233F5|nr:NAD(P)/FAD-dependent oxidoreductase [Stenotrophomonas maltophilia]